MVVHRLRSCTPLPSPTQSERDLDVDYMLTEEERRVRLEGLERVARKKAEALRQKQVAIAHSAERWAIDPRNPSNRRREPIEREAGPNNSLFRSVNHMRTNLGTMSNYHNPASINEKLSIFER